jgi:hypothetical protein
MYFLTKYWHSCWNFANPVSFARSMRYFAERTHTTTLPPKKVFLNRRPLLSQLGSSIKGSGKTVEISGNDVDGAIQRLSKIISHEGIAKKLREMKIGAESPCHVARRERKNRERIRQRRIVQEVLKKVIEERRLMAK